VRLVEDGRSFAPAEFPLGGRLFALCERDLLAVLRMVDEARFTVLIAPGRDGDLATAAAEAIGVRVVRGSSRRGGREAFAGLVRALEGSQDPAMIVVDGPLGPDGVPKPGILACATATGRAVVPVATAARRSIVFGAAWSRMYLPLAFTELVIACGPPIPPPPPGRDTRAALLPQLQAALARARERAREEIDRGRNAVSAAAARAAGSA